MRIVASRKICTIPTVKTNVKKDQNFVLSETKRGLEVREETPTEEEFDKMFDLKKCEAKMVKKPEKVTYRVLRGDGTIVRETLQRTIWRRISGGSGGVNRGEN